MKKSFSRLLLLMVVLFTVSTAASAQIYVRIRPPVPVIVRPPQPSRTHVWIDEEWAPNGRSYRYSGGHWATPPRRGYHRQQGHWKQTRRGNVWVQGRWSRH
ncbi:MAG: YXWGXW repeat-containing protein [Chitinophagaceae bacterium]|nr:YXWGXW repeat-containing protein [Chitinophagaceae bacterium]MBL0056922.1 YXWGXW repeat-containing protein [Chitinophagaceae bacterium]